MSKCGYGNILVVGDIMLDYYHVGSIERISPEAPVPVFDEEDEYRTLGGAGNVALNIKSLLPEYNVYLLTASGFQTIHESELKGVELISGSYVTSKLIEKHRFIDKRNKQQIGLRYDKFFNRYDLKKNAFDAVSDKFFDVIVFSDYNKGCFDNIDLSLKLIEKAKKDHSITLLDSKSSENEMFKFHGVDIFKPNKSEFYKISTHFKRVVRTESEKGMTLFDNGKERFHVDSCVKDIISSVGAGDTALAGLVYGVIDPETTIQQSVRYANFLAGRACMHPGTYVVTQEDLKAAHAYALEG